MDYEILMNGNVKIGTYAPDFEANTTMGQITLNQYKGKWVVLFSHPGDFTPVCTTEIIAFSKANPYFEQLNACLLGLSVDSNASHLAWIYDIYCKTGIRVPFPIIADRNGAIARKYGMISNDVSTTETVRNVFLIDEKGMVRLILVYPMNVGRCIPEILRALNALQVADSNKASTPANWIPNQPIIMPPPKTFEELIRISGLSHGTDVWLNNAQTLINEGTIKLDEAICTRDDIMIYLIKEGLPPQKAFKIMEFVRKGKPSKDPEKWKEHEATMREYNIPEWYIGSCKKIKYMFPKAHAAAYVTNAFRIAWFKVHIPKAYYAAYFTIRADAFDSDIMCQGVERVKNKMKEIELAGKAATKKDQDTYGVLEIVLEMYERGLNFLPIDLYESDSVKFKVEEDGIRPPLNSIPGLGTVAAQGIQSAREDGEFMSIDDLKIRAKVGKSVIEILTNAGCLKGMSQSNQMSLFA